MRITVISGGLAGAQLVSGLVDQLQDSHDRAEVTVIANTGDDITLAGLRACPDLDALLAQLSDASPAATTVVSDELTSLGVHPDWYRVGDGELAVQLARTAWLGQGATLSEVTATLAERRGLTERGVRLLPMSDVPVETHAVLDGEQEQQAVHVQQWRHDLGAPPATRFIVAGMDRATAAPGVLDALREADVVVLAPADPVLSIGIVLGVAGVRDALRGTSAPIVGVTPDLADLGPSLAAVDVERTADGVASLYRDLRITWLPADASPADVLAITRTG
ncbi:2-phospho-L-lactate transferase CofD family protein [Janibacter limosus]|uniref:2-phospho-L-lactate transferase n=1 Tax=Janibacter limosus TaxID=53458 RepID=A0A4P6MPQ9_9MICO|nr:2-phospho-L-lactate transferase CofD family protein [Janibacter limosus]QBF45354.1 2-phospho-L-lactate transferase [Janibacter limosus]